MIIQKLKENIKPAADKLMALFLQVFSSKSASVHEEALMAVGALANGKNMPNKAFSKQSQPLKVTLKSICPILDPSLFLD